MKDFSSMLTESFVNEPIESISEVFKRGGIRKAYKKHRDSVKKIAGKAVDTTKDVARKAYRKAGELYDIATEEIPERT